MFKTLKKIIKALHLYNILHLGNVIKYLKYFWEKNFTKIRGNLKTLNRKRVKVRDFLNIIDIYI